MGSDLIRAAIYDAIQTEIAALQFELASAKFGSFDNNPAEVFN
jgi:hypothetical protein